MENTIEVSEPPSQAVGILLQLNHLNFDVQVGINLLIIVLLLMLSALASGSEVAFFSLNKDQINDCEKSHNKKELSVFKLLQRPKLLLATILITNNFINVALVTLITISTWRIFGVKDIIGGLLTALTIATTFMIVFFGEILPKVYATRYNLSFATKMAKSIQLLNIAFKPLSFILTSSTSLVEKRLKKHMPTLSAEDMHEAIEITADQEVSQEEKDILKGIVNFGNTTAKQIMSSRIDVAAFDNEMNFHSLMDKIIKLGFSRIPVYEETIDQIKGLLYIKDLLPHINEEDSFNWHKFIRPAYFIPETKKINDLLKDFQQKKVHMAIIVDEYGGTSGLVTLEDVIEEIVGDINDEFDDDEINFSKINKNTFIFEGKTSINDFSRILDINSDVFENVKGENESLGGLMLELFSKIPHVGDETEYQNFKFKIQSVDTKRVKRIKVIILNNNEHEAA